jgi:hypothetical protein
MCLDIGPVVKLTMGIEPSLYVDSAQPNFAFNPCGHMTSESTARFVVILNIISDIIRRYPYI